MACSSITHLQAMISANLDRSIPAGPDREGYIAHDFCLAVIKEAVQRKSMAPTERFQPPRAETHFHALTQRFVQGPSHAPKSWVGVVVGESSPATALPAERIRHGGVVGAAAASRAPPPAGTCRAPAPAEKPLEQAQPVTPSPPAGIPAGFLEMMGAAIEAAMKPLLAQLEATIVPMQRTIESLQAEFVAMRELAPAGDDDMSDAAASEMALALRDQSEAATPIACRRALHD